MKKLLSIPFGPFALAFSLITAVHCGNPSLSAADSGDNKDSVSHGVQWRIDSLMKAHFTTDGPGVVLAVEQDRPAGSGNDSGLVINGLWSAEFATGVNDFKSKKPVDKNSVFNIGSLTKQFTARAILGSSPSTSLENRIGKYLKGLPPAIAALKISQLLSHCSGIPDHYGYTDTNLVKHARNKDVLEAVRKADTLYFPAGTHYRYSNTAYCLLGMLLSTTHKQVYDSIIQKELVYAPHQNSMLHFPSMSFLPASAVIGNRVHGYEKSKSGVWAESDAPESIFFTTEADGGMLISITDYIHWCGGLEKYYDNGTRFPEFEPHTLVDTAAGLYYGYGWFVLPRKENKNGKLIYHTGFNGGFRTSVLLIPELHYRIAIFSASPGVDLEDLVHQINIILGIDDKGFIKSGPLES